MIAEIAALVGDPARATMVSALLAGRALTASELAFAARITPQTASTHLGKLTEAGWDGGASRRPSASPRPNQATAGNASRAADALPSVKEPR